jgi:thiamine pyrophosphokinase
MSPTCEPDPGNAGVGRPDQQGISGHSDRMAFFVACDYEGRRTFCKALHLGKAMTHLSDRPAVLIFANGELATTEWVAPYLAQATAVLAADGGAQHLLELNRLPDLLIGDLDSISPEQQRRLQEGGTEIIAHSRAKEQTDLELALEYAVAHYENAPILIFATLGGRLDQTLANILLLAHPALHGRAVQLVEPHQRAWLIESGTQIRGRPGDTVSLIPLGGDVLVTETSGLRWPLHDERLLFGPARGVSNEMVAEVATVNIAAGRLLCIHTSGGDGS